jgi:hypothetical protein
MLTQAPRISTTAMRLLASTSEFAHTAKIACTDRCSIRNRSRVLVVRIYGYWLGYGSLERGSSRTKPFERTALEQTVKVISIESKTVELGTECRATDESYLVVLSNVGSKQIQITSIMAAGEEDVFALIVFHEETEHFADLVVSILLLVTCIDEIEKILCACEV